MPAVSGSPTQIQTSVLTPTALAGTPDDQFKEGDVAFVASLYPNAQFILRRSPLLTPPDNVTTIATYSGNGYWELSPATFVAGGSAGLFNPALASIATADATPTVLVNVIPSFLVASSKDYIFDVTATVEGILNAANVYRVDLNATFLYTASTSTLTQLIAPVGTTLANERFLGSGFAGMATITNTGDLTVTGVVSEDWKWSATLSDFYLKGA